MIPALHVADDPFECADFRRRVLEGAEAASVTAIIPGAYHRPSDKGASNSMSYQSFLASLNEPALVAAAEHWNEARASGLTPAWRDINPNANQAVRGDRVGMAVGTVLDTLIGRLAREDTSPCTGLTCVAGA